MGQVLLDHLPDYYSGVKEIRLLSQIEGNELDGLSASFEEAFNQRFVDTATWGLVRWEKELGINPTAGQPFDQRRSVIRSKMRGTGTVTVRLMKSVAEAFDRGALEVTVQPELYSFTIRFVDTLGAPPNVNDLKAAIENIKPAHLTVIYKYKYLLISQIHKTMTIDELQQRRLTDFSPFIPID